MLEAEVQTQSLEEVMDVVERMIRCLVTNLSKSELFNELMSLKNRGEHGDDSSSTPFSDLIRGRWDGLIRNPWPRITFEEAMHRLHSAAQTNESIFEHQPSWNAGLQLEHEKFIAAEVGHGSPVFVTHYPQGIKPFYMLPSKASHIHFPDIDASNTAACFDVLLPEVCEVVGGSLREHRFKHLIRSMHKHGLTTSIESQRPQEKQQVSTSPPPEAGGLDWYVDLRRYGSIPHGGFGLGFDRLLGYLAGIHNIKDVVPWPRYHGRCDC